MGQPTIPPTPAEINLAGKTVIITGANSGLGLETARQFLVLRVSRVILAVRSLPRGRDAAAALRADAAVKQANPNALIEAFELDVDDYQSGQRFCTKVKSEVKELDILVNNAGVVLLSFEQSKSGHERVFQVNCYTHLLITLSLLPLLRSTAALRKQPTHVTWLSSGLSKNHTFSKNHVPPNTSILSYLDGAQRFAWMTCYNDSKLVVNDFIRRLARVAGPDEVVFNCLCPGLLKPTGVDRNIGWGLGQMVRLYRTISGRDVAAGARTVVFATTAAGEETQGKLLQHNLVDDDASAWLDEPAGKEFSEKLWKEIVEDISHIDPQLAAFA